MTSASAGYCSGGRWGANARAVDVHRVAADRLDDGNPLGGERLAERRDLRDSEREVVLVENLLEPDRDRLEIAAREPAVRRKALDEDQLVLEPLDPRRIPQREEAPDVGEAVLLRAHRAAVGQGEDLGHDLAHRAADWPASRCLTNHAFSAKRQASMINGIPNRRQSSLVARTFASDTGCPPPSCSSA
jgi:hypothetical protein